MLLDWGIQKSLPILLVIVFALGAWSDGAFAQVDVEVRSSPKSAGPNDFVTHTFEIFNGGADATYDLRLDLPVGMTPIGFPNSIFVGGGTSVPLFVTVLVTNQALANENEIILTATSQASSADTDSAIALIDVLEVAEINVNEPDDIQAQVGTTVDVEFLLSNRGNTINAFQVLVELAPRVPFDVTPSQLTLQPGESAVLVVTIDIPVELDIQFINIMMEVNSTLFPDVTAEANARVELLPPSSSAFSTNLNLDIPFEVLGAVDPIVGFISSPSVPLSFATEFRLPPGINLTFVMREGDLADAAFFPTFSVALEFLAASILFDTGGRFTSVLDFEPFFLTFFSAADGNELSGRFSAPLAGASFSGAFTLSTLDTGDPATSGTTSTSLANLGFALGPLNTNFTLLHNSPAPFQNSADELSLAMTLSSGVSGAVVVFSLGTDIENLAKNINFSSVADTSANLRTRIDGGQDQPAFTAEIQYEQALGEGPGGSFDVNNKILTLSINAGQRVLSLMDVSIFNEHSNIFNAVTNDSFTVDRSALAGEVDLDFLTLRLELERDRTRDNTVARIIEGENRTIAQISALLNNLSFNMRLDRTDVFGLDEVVVDRETNISTSISVLFDNFSISSSANLQYGEDTGLIGAGVGLSFQTLFVIPTPFPVKGQVEGVVFIDFNENGIRDEDEPGVPNTVVSIGDFNVLTDSIGDQPGFYRSPPLDPGEYQINLVALRNTLIPGTELPITFNVFEGQRRFIDIPLLPIGGIDGVVFNDLDRDGQQDADEPGLSGIAVELTGGLLEDTFRLRTGDNGFFIFDDLPAGEYVVRLDENTLPNRFETTSPSEVVVNLQIGQRALVTFGTFQRPREILFAPAADFTFTPSNPRAGQVVTFDASLTFDFDGEVVSYEWDFDSDGVIDAEGVTVTHIFETPGEFEVTLIATDDDGQQGVKGPVLIVVQ